MKLRVIGRSGPYPAPGEVCSGYLLSGESGDIAIDMGCGVLPKLMELTDITKLSAIILSHLHPDHMSDMSVLTHALMFTGTRPIDVYAPDEPENIRALFNSRVYNWCTLSDGMEANVGGFSFSFLRVCHPIEAYAIRVSENGKTLVYSGDTNVSPGLVDFSKKADLLLCDGGISESDWKPDLPHLSPERAARMAAEADVDLLVVTHINPCHDENQIAASAKAVFSRSLVAKPGQVFEL